jgi:hypothetical protein
MGARIASHAVDHMPLITRPDLVVDLVSEALRR